MKYQITAIYAAVLALLYMGLALRVVLARRAARVGLGDGDNKRLEQTIRAHANCSEYVPIALILLILLEQTTLTAWSMHAAGAALLAARILHAWGLSHSSGESFGRFYGTLLTWMVIVFSALALLKFSFFR